MRYRRKVRRLRRKVRKQVNEFKFLHLKKITFKQRNYNGRFKSYEGVIIKVNYGNSKTDHYLDLEVYTEDHGIVSVSSQEIESILGLSDKQFV